MSRRDPRITLAQIRDADEKARTLCAAHTLESLLADWTATAALERCIEIVGEGVRRLPNELKQRRGDIPLRTPILSGNCGLFQQSLAFRLAAEVGQASACHAPSD